MFLCPFEMVVYVAARSLIVGMVGYAVAHHGDYFKRLVEWFH
jgi:hypothetical protein